MSAASGRAITPSTSAASWAVRANTETQSSDRQAGTTPVGAHQPERRLAADDVAERGRDPTRPGGVGAEGERDEAGGDRDARAGTRPARHHRGIERVARCAVGRARPDQTGGELIEIRLAGHDRPRRGQVVDRRGRRRRHRTERRTAGGGLDPGDIDVVLHGERHTAQRTADRAHHRELERHDRHPLGCVRIEVADPHRSIAVGVDARERRRRSPPARENSPAR